jgi:anti-sigma factor RsiW
MIDYVDVVLPTRQRFACWLHVSMCRKCARFVRQYKQTIALGQKAFDSPDEPVPDSIPDELVKAALAHRKANKVDDSR